MPSLEHFVPELTPKTLIRKTARAERVIASMKATYRAKTAMALRREETALVSAFEAMLALGPENAPKAVAVYGALDRCRARMAEILGWPKRPTDSKHSRRPTMPVLELMTAEPKDEQDQEGHMESDSPG